MARIEKNGIKPFIGKVTGKQIAHNGTEYVFLETKLPVSSEDMSKATIEQFKDYKSTLQDSLMTFCDMKENEIYQAILGYKATEAQIGRYTNKYQRAKAGAWDEATNAVIIKNYEDMEAIALPAIDALEYFRSAVDDLLIAGDLDEAADKLFANEDFNASKTIADMEELLTA